MEKKEAMKILKDFYDKSALYSIRTALDIVIPELKESDGDNILNCIRICLTDANEQRFKDYKTSLKDCLAWLQKQGEQKPAENKGMNIVEEDMTPFQKKVFSIIDTAIEEEQGLKQVCDELLRLAHDDIMQKPAWSEENEKLYNDLSDTYFYNGRRTRKR